MAHRRYMHVERLDSDEVTGLLEGKCYVFPKLDGTNASLWLGEEGNIHAGSRKRDLVGEKDNFDFYTGYLMGRNYERFLKFFECYPNWRLYGEYLVKHTLKTYRDDAWQKFYIFDVWEEPVAAPNGGEPIVEGGRYIPYDEYQPVLEQFGLEYIPPLAVIDFPTDEQLLKVMAEHNTYLIEDGKGVGEGIVIKNYCVALGHRVLTEDLRWVPVESLQIGDALVGFNAHLPYSKWERSEVLSCPIITAPIFEILLSDGTALTATKEHPWVYAKARKHHTGYVWRKTCDLKPGMVTRRLLPTWNTELSYEAGWLGGFFDGEGSLVHGQPSLPYGSLQIGASQKEGLASSRASEFLTKLGFEHTVNPYDKQKPKIKKIFLTGGRQNALRFLGSIRPIRLLAKLNINVLGGIKAGRNIWKRDLLTVESVRPLGIGKVVALSTTTETYLVEGFGSHNTFVNEWGRPVWGKMVRTVFKEENRKEWGAPYMKKKSPTEQQIAITYVTEGRVNKTIAKMRASGPWTRKRIPELFQTVFRDIVEEEMRDIIEKFKDPIINFRRLRNCIVTAVKEAKPELF